MVTETSLPLLVNITEWSKLLLSQTPGALSESLYENFNQIYANSQALHLRLTEALNTQEDSSNTLLHELRGSLNIIIGYSEIMLDGLDDPLNDDQRLLLRKIYNNALILSARILELYG